MEYQLAICSWVIVLSLESVSLNTLDVEDYCIDDTFHAECGSDSVIFMQEARYGRMELGTCLTLDVGFFGCFSDVLPEMDGWCSGRRSCHVPVHSFVPIEKPCPVELGGYLQASFTCTPVVSPGPGCCFVPDGGIIVHADGGSGYIASSMTVTSGCGRRDCPWQVVSMRQQSMSISIFDFGYGTHSSPEHGGNGLYNNCIVYAIINEAAIGFSQTVCAGSVRNKHLHTTSSNAVEIAIVTDENEGNTPSYFLLEYKVHGCADPSPPNHGLVERNGDLATIRCIGSQKSWDIICVGGHWSVINETCATGSHPADTDDDGSTGQWGGFHFNMAIILIVAVAVIISLTVLTIGVVCIAKRRSTSGLNRRDCVTTQPDNYQAGMGAYRARQHQDDNQLPYHDGYQIKLRDIYKELPTTQLMPSSETNQYQLQQHIVHT